MLLEATQRLDARSTTVLLNTIPLSKVIEKYFYADDTQVCLHLFQKHLISMLDKMRSCLYGVQESISSSKLKLILKNGFFFPLLHKAEKVRNLGFFMMCNSLLLISCL